MKSISTPTIYTGNSLSGHFYKWINYTWAADDGFLQMFYNGIQGDMGFQGMFYNSSYGSFTDVNDQGTLPENYALYPVFPNPFNPVTVIRYALPVAGDVMMSVYDALGKRIKIILNQEMPAGEHEVVFDAKNLPSGTYFVTMKAGKFVKSQKILLLK